MSSRRVSIKSESASAQPGGPEICDTNPSMAKSSTLSSASAADSPSVVPSKPSATTVTSRRPRDLRSPTSVLTRSLNEGGCASPTYSRTTAEANGRNDSRRILFIVDDEPVTQAGYLHLGSLLSRLGQLDPQYVLPNGRKEKLAHPNRRLARQEPSGTMPFISRAQDEHH